MYLSLDSATDHGNPPAQEQDGLIHQRWTGLQVARSCVILVDVDPVVEIVDTWDLPDPAVIEMWGHIKGDGGIGDVFRQSPGDIDLT